MKSRKIHSVTVLATGFVVLLLLSLPLFWARWLCEINLLDMMPRDSREITMRPSGLVPSELENDPNVVQHSYISASMEHGELDFIFLGIFDYFLARGPKGRYSNIYQYDKDDEEWTYFDEDTGQIVCHYTQQERLPDNTLHLRKVQLYAGPEGISETSDKTLGRFIYPLVDKDRPWLSLFTLYDKKLRRFFQINFRDRTVTKGPKLVKDVLHNPIQIGRIVKNWPQVKIYWEPPKIKISEEDKEKRSYRIGDTKPIIIDVVYNTYQYLLILDATGRIDLLDMETLEFAGSAGYLPAPETLYPSKKFVTTKDLLAYEVRPLNLSPFRPESNYRGIFTACVNREGTSMAVAVFDKEGKMITNSYTKATEYAERRRTVTVPTSKAVFWEVPWAPTLTITKYLLENLHPPILSLASYSSAGSIEAGAGHRALFILPNSFIAMKGRDVRSNMTERFFAALIIILPSILLAIFLAWRVGKDATVVGLSENSRIFWILVTIAFGLAGYITYRLTRPKVTLVTCANCGRMRRPDMEKCHRCGSKWHVPELIPPTWRVIDT